MRYKCSPIFSVVPQGTGAVVTTDGLGVLGIGCWIPALPAGRLVAGKRIVADGKAVSWAEGVATERVIGDLSASWRIVIRLVDREGGRRGESREKNERIMAERSWLK